MRTEDMALLVIGAAIILGILWFVSGNPSWYSLP